MPYSSICALANNGRHEIGEIFAFQAFCRVFKQGMGNLGLISGSADVPGVRDGHVVYRPFHKATDYRHDKTLFVYDQARNRLNA
jgi:hypothetical protein